MENLNTAKATVITVGGAIGGFFAWLFGGWSGDIAALVVLATLDFLSGLIIALVFKKSPKTETGAASSNTAFKGFAKKVMMFAFVVVGNLADNTLKTDYIKPFVIYGFMANEILSLIENAGLMGLPLPSIITKAVDLLRGKSGDKEDKEDKDNES